VPLIPPALDDRSYGDLLEEMLASIPAHTPEWTSPQPGDPGQTLIEMFAWLADSILYRANLIPERQRLAYLKLLGQTLQPAAAARGLVTLASDPAKTAVMAAVTGASLTGAATFETLSEIDVLPVSGQVYIKMPLSADQTTASMPLLTGLRTLYGLSGQPTGYTTTPVFAQGQVSATGIDLAAETLDQCLWFALIAAKAENRDAARDAITGKGTTYQVANIGFVPALTLPDPFADVGPRAAVPCTWQMSLNTPVSARQPAQFVTLSVVDDTTQRLTRPGVVRLAIPQNNDIGGPPNDVRADSQAGVGPKPPRIDDPDIDTTLVTWIRMSVQGAVSVSWAGLNAVEIDQRTTYNLVVLGVSDGTAAQMFSLGQAQIDPDTFALEIDMPGLGYQLWQAVDDLAPLQGQLQAYVLDPEAGTVTFGNGLQGAIPPLGRRIRVNKMRVGGGSSGNLPANSLTKITARDVNGNQLGPITVVQPIATTGGADSETLTMAEQRLPGLIRHQNRAVTADDYKTLAMEIPGASVARAEVLPLFKPQTRSQNIPGVVSVMVLPEKVGVQPPCPRADRPLLETVYGYLDARRPATAEMYVIATEYVGLGVAVAVEALAGFGLLQIQQQVELALRNYLWPLVPGGTMNQGWTLGRTVRSLELEVIVSQVPGVIEVNGLTLFSPVYTPSTMTGGAATVTSYTPLLQDANGRSELTIQSWQLPELLQVLVSAGVDGSGIAVATSLAPPVVTDNSVAVPVVPKVC
jgi:predicted phage baseplate assembly protein